MVLLLGVVAVDQLIDVSFAFAADSQAILGYKVSFVNFALLAILGIVFVLFELMGQMAQKNMDYALEIQRSKLEAAYFSDIEQAVEILHDVRHDMKHHVEVLHGLLRAQDYAALNRYFAEIAGELNISDDIVLTGNPTVNALLTSKIMAARKKDIAVSFSIDPVGEFPLQSIDVCSLLGNLLDNATEACLKVSGKENQYIDLRIQTKNDMLLIEIKNSFSGSYHRLGDKFLSDKGPGHGIGLRHVKKIVKNMDGVVEISANHQDFTVSILIPFQQNSGTVL